MDNRPSIHQLMTDQPYHFRRLDMCAKFASTSSKRTAVKWVIIQDPNDLQAHLTMSIGHHDKAYRTHAITASYQAGRLLV